MASNMTHQGQQYKGNSRRPTAVNLFTAYDRNKRQESPVTPQLLARKMPSEALRRHEMLNMKQVGWMTGQRKARTSSRYVGNQGRYIATVPKNNRYRPGGDGIMLCTGQSFVLKVCPNASQLFLAFATLLFFASFECILITITTVGPGLEARNFISTKCTVINTFYNGNTSCFVSSVSSQGVVNVFPCLQIYVSPLASVSTSAAANRTKREVSSVLLSDSLLTSSFGDQPESTRSKRAAGSQSGQNTTGFLMFQNELNFAGNDYLYRRCSYLPSRCPTDLQQTKQEIYNYAQRWGAINQTYDCYFSAQADQSMSGRVMRSKVITNSAMWNSVVWPLVGMVIGVVCCFGFWRRSYRHMSRLFIYNSWSAS